MKKLTVILTLVMIAAFAVSAMAVPPGKTVEFAGGAEGKVTFDGKVHSVKKCNDCHPKVFQMKKGSSKITAPHEAGKFCATCHDGTTAWAIEGNCAKCHVK